ncbi:MAG: CoA transferase [Deltaproteobacteria bacterium]|nr:CoA transferase [Deltaproteobacteria bacterium]
MSGPLRDIRYLDLAPYGPGGHCSRILADMGADVIRIAEPSQSSAREGRIPDVGSTVYSLRRNTRVIGLDLKNATAREVFYRLAKTADAMGVGLRPSVPKRLGIDYATLAEMNPRIVYCSMTGFGATGPYADFIGHDINFQGLAGLAAMTGEAGGKPYAAGTVGDAAGGGMQGVIGILAGIIARGSTGRGQLVDAGATDGLLNIVHRWIEMYLETGERMSRGTEMAAGKYAWYDIYATKDGKYVSVGAVEPYCYANLCRGLGREDFIPHQYDDDRIDEMRAIFTRIFRTRTRDQWAAELMPQECCVAPVYEIDELVDDPHFKSRRAILELQHPSRGEIRQVAPMTRFSETPSEIGSLEPQLGDFTQGILESLGYSRTELADLIESGTVV